MLGVLLLLLLFGLACYLSIEQLPPLPLPRFYSSRPSYIILWPENVATFQVEDS
jgi:hypothetical protein